MVIDPSKVKRSKHRRPRFLVVYFSSPHYQEAMKRWGEIKSYTTLHPVVIWLRELCRNPAVGDFLGGDSGLQSRRLRPARPEALTLDRRLRPPKLGFHLSGASLCCLPRVFEKGLRRLRGLCTREPETPGDTGDSGLQSPETPGLVDPMG
jgi:hypothetical protein